ncbi:MAG: hypothetical protein K6F86_08830 [Lachnospiraceae bacterium]|nr:hypothetical protein [Lachnospiraceae bacterium]
MNTSEIEKRFADILAPVAEENGCRLVKTEYVKESGNWFLRGYIEKPEGDVSINDCTMISRIISKKLDKEDFIDEAYTMEICSPGFME